MVPRVDVERPGELEDEELLSDNTDPISGDLEKTRIGCDCIIYDMEKIGAISKMHAKHQKNLLTRAKAACILGIGDVVQNRTVRQFA